MKAITMIKKYIISLLLLSSVTSNATVLIDQSNTIKPIPTSKPWTFELKNKTPQTFWISIQNGNKIALYDYQLAASKGKRDKDYTYLRLSGLNLKLPIIVTVVSESGAIQSFAITPDEKTVYVSYDKRTLAPQKGGGLLNRALSKTASGLSLANNIDGEDITALSKQESEKNLEEIIAAHMSELQNKWKSMSLAELESERFGLNKQIPAYSKEEQEMLDSYETELRRQLVDSWENMTPSELEKEARAVAKKQYSNDSAINKDYMNIIQGLIKKNAGIDPFSRNRDSKNIDIQVN